MRTKVVIVDEDGMIRLEIVRLHISYLSMQLSVLTHHAAVPASIERWSRDLELFQCSPVDSLLGMLHRQKL